MEHCFHYLQLVTNKKHIYPDQDKEEEFTFDRYEEPIFDKVSGYIRFYKMGIKLPVIEQ